ncbi:MAG: EF-P beta-lysylation protein EpmB [Gammaproteobacteria bacterium]|nr:EF-P beta-lysylation protein EpmB [Gammaproteobacteria bacterium]
MIPKTGAIIPRTDGLDETQTTPEWQRILAAAIRDPAELATRLGLPPLAPGVAAASQDFRLLVPEPYLQRIQPGNLNDPLLLQVLPRTEENLTVSGYSSDPLGEQAATAAPGILHKYQGRVLVIATPSCAVHCRYCFRRHFPYADSRPDRTLEQLTGHLLAHPEIREVILSGGDPLTLSDDRLAEWSEVITRQPRITTLRIHTRLPIVIPQRVTPNLLEWLGTLPIKPVVVLHANHPNEIDLAVIDACNRLSHQGVTLLNQAVLLRGVNDQADTLIELSDRLFQAGVLPYYLHLLDPVSGTAHFEVSEHRAIELISSLRARLPGYLVPRLAREQAGHPAKTIIAG